MLLKKCMLKNIRYVLINQQKIFFISVINHMKIQRRMHNKYPAHLKLGWLSFALCCFIIYIQAAPTIMRRMNNTTINAKPPPYPYPYPPLIIYTSLCLINDLFVKIYLTILTY